LGLFAFFASSVLLVAGCNVLYNTENEPRDVFDKVRSVDLSPRSPQSIADDNPSPKGGRPRLYPGDGAVTHGTGQNPGGENAEARPSGDGYELNFENTPVTTVAKVVLGDILGEGYTIDPRVQGTVTLSSGRPVPRRDILFVLESALRVSNVAVVRDAAGYRLVPLAEAAGGGNTDRIGAAAEPGFGVTVIPLQYISAQTLLKLLDSFAVKAGSVRADTGRNMLVVQGNGAERRVAIDTVRSFDADWMRGQSVGIFPIHNSTAEPIITELEKIVDSGEGGLSQNMVRFQTVDRMNAILVVSRKPELFKTIGTWIARLDNVDTASAGVKIYHVRYGEAGQIARLLNEIFLGGSSGGSLDSPTNEIAPGAGLRTTSSSGNTGAGNQSIPPSLGGQPTSTPGGLGGVGTRPGGIGGGEAQRTPGTTLGGTSARDAGGNNFGGGASGGGGAVLPGVRITADITNNTLLIYANQERYRIIERTLRQLDRPQLQVAIDTTIAEVTLTKDLTYGVQFFLTSKNLGFRPDYGSIVNSTGGSSSSSSTGTAGSIIGPVLQRALPGFNFLLGGELQPSAILDALNTVTEVKVLSNPSIVVLDNQLATLQVGDQVPISTGSATVLTSNNTVVSTIDYRNTGIILRVVPRINFNGKVQLDIEQEISDVSPNSVGSLTPTITQRKVKSSIAVASGQTVLLAGLISETRGRARSGIPLLDDITGIGDAFSHTNKSLLRTELILFIRPQIIRDSVDAQYVAEELRSKLSGRIGSIQGQQGQQGQPAPVAPRPVVK
jgi:general secretion pathway protein D